MGRLLWFGRTNANVLGSKHARIANKRQLQRGKSPQAWSNIRGDPGGKACARIDWAAKTNEMSVDKQMPLLSEFTGCSERGNDAKRWTRMLYNRHVSLSIDCFIINLKGSGDWLCKEAIGHLEHKSKSKMDENEDSLKKGVNFEHIDSKWMFKVFKSPCIRNRRGRP